MTAEQPTAHPVISNPIAAITCDTLLEVRGPDALKFLQGQTSADFLSAGAMSVLPGCFCDVKGRVLTDFLALVVNNERVLLRISADVAEQIQQHLTKYLMFSKAEMRPSELTVFGSPGEETAPELTRTDLASPEPAKGWHVAMPSGAGYVIQHTDRRLEHFLPAPLEPELPGGSGGYTEEHWLAAGIRQGEARIRAPIWGLYLPQDLNYDLRGLINFRKGCYTGQEVIARLHWRGTPKRRLYRAQIKPTPGGLPPPVPGTSIRAAAGEQKIGSVINAVAEADALELLIETTEAGAGSELYCEGCATPLVNIQPAQQQPQREPKP